MRHFLACILLAISVNFLYPVPAAAAPSWTLEYRHWSGFYEPRVFTLHLQLDEVPWGLRLWNATGYDENTCATGECWVNDFRGADLTYRLNPSMSLFVGTQYLYRRTESYAMSHQGWRVGFIGNVDLAPRLTGVYEVALMPGDLFRDSEGVVRPGLGAMYRLGVTYEVTPSSYVQIGTWSWGFNIAGAGGKGGFTDHVWLGPYITVGKKF